MHENQIYRKHSDEFREVIERFPKKSNHRLFFLLILIISIGLFLGWVIKSPDIVLAEIKVTAEKPPISIISKLSGNIKLKINSYGEIVNKGQYIALIKNSANEDHILTLKKKLLTFSFDSIPKFEDFSFALKYNLGELQSNYFDFIKTLYEYNRFKNFNKLELEINSINRQINNVNEGILMRGQVINLKKQNIQLSKKYSESDSILSKKNAIPKVEFEKSKKELLKEKEALAFEQNLLVKDELNLITLKSKRSLLSIENVESNETISVNLLTIYQKLLSSIIAWEENYVFKSPINGVLENLKFLNDNQFIKQGEALFSVLPLDNSIIGQALLPSEGAGKVSPNQNVIIKLDTYPYQEFGVISGKIKSISLIPLEKVYLVSIDLPNKLLSDNGIELNFSKEMSGQAEIITKKRRLIYRLFEKIKYAFDRKRKENIIEEKNKSTENDKR